MWDSSADHKHNTVLLFFEDAIDPLGPAGFKIGTGPGSGYESDTVQYLPLVIALL